MHVLVFSIQPEIQRLLPITAQTRKTKESRARRCHAKATRHTQHHDQKSKILGGKNMHILSNSKTADGTGDSSLHPVYCAPPLSSSIEQS